MDETRLKLTQFFQGLSESYGTGFLQQDILFVMVLGLCVFTLVGTFIFLRTRKHRQFVLGDDFARLSGVVGRIERFEKEVNEFRTGLMREVEFLKQRVSELEAGRAQVKPTPAQPTPVKPTQVKSTPVKSTPVQPTEVQPTNKAPSSAPDSSRTSATFTHPLDDDDDSEDDLPSAEQRVFPDISREAFVKESEERTAPEPEKKPETLSIKLSKTRRGLFDRLRNVFVARPQLDEETIEELEALLVGSDLGVRLSSSLIEDLRSELSSGKEVDEELLTSLLKMKVLSILEADAPMSSDILPKKRAGSPLIVMMVGVNGVGKTTTTAKLASQWSKSGAKVLMAAADTFRAAAVEQIVEWGKRIDVPVVRGAEEAKPGAVVFDAVERAINEDFDVLIIDTAGRLHTKSNLMQELEGLRNIIQKHIPDGPHESILVVDGSTGQNALSQAKEFNQAVSLSGVVVTKLDGTPKGGIVVAIKDEIGIPVRYIGVGESEADLRSFVPRDFVEALFDTAGTGQLSEPSAHGKKRRRRRREEPDAANA